MRDSQLRQIVYNPDRCFKRESRLELQSVR
jgi:hypothetical protein